MASNIEYFIKDKDQIKIFITFLSNFNKKMEMMINENNIDPTNPENIYKYYFPDDINMYNIINLMFIIEYNNIKSDKKSELNKEILIRSDKIFDNNYNYVLIEYLTKKKYKFDTALHISTNLYQLIDIINKNQIYNINNYIYYEINNQDNKISARYNFSRYNLLNNNTKIANLNYNILNKIIDNEKILDELLNTKDINEQINIILNNILLNTKPQFYFESFYDAQNIIKINKYFEDKKNKNKNIINRITKINNICKEISINEEFIDKNEELKQLDKSKLVDLLDKYKKLIEKEENKLIEDKKTEINQKLIQTYKFFKQSFREIYEWYDDNIIYNNNKIKKTFFNPCFENRTIEYNNLKYIILDKTLHDKLFINDKDKFKNTFYYYLLNNDDNLLNTYFKEYYNNLIVYFKQNNIPSKEYLNNILYQTLKNIINNLKNNSNEISFKYYLKNDIEQNNQDLKFNLNKDINFFKTFKNYDDNRLIIIIFQIIDNLPKLINNLNNQDKNNPIDNNYLNNYTFNIFTILNIKQWFNILRNKKISIKKIIHNIETINFDNINIDDIHITLINENDEKMLINNFLLYLISIYYYSIRCIFILLKKNNNGLIKFSEFINNLLKLEKSLFNTLIIRYSKSKKNKDLKSTLLNKIAKIFESKNQKKSRYAKTLNLFLDTSEYDEIFNDDRLQLEWKIFIALCKQNLDDNLDEILDIIFGKNKEIFKYNNLSRDNIINSIKNNNLVLGKILKFDIFDTIDKSFLDQLIIIKNNKQNIPLSLIQKKILKLFYEKNIDTNIKNIIFEYKNTYDISIKINTKLLKLYLGLFYDIPFNKNISSENINLDNFFDINNMILININNSFLNKLNEENIVSFIIIGYRFLQNFEKYLFKCLVINNCNKNYYAFVEIIEDYFINIKYDNIEIFQYIEK